MRQAQETKSSFSLNASRKIVSLAVSGAIPQSIFQRLESAGAEIKVSNGERTLGEIIELGTVSLSRWTTLATGASTYGLSILGTAKDPTEQGFDGGFSTHFGGENTCVSIPGGAAKALHLALGKVLPAKNTGSAEFPRLQILDEHIYCSTTQIFGAFKSGTPAEDKRNYSCWMFEHLETDAKSECFNSEIVP